MRPVFFADPSDARLREEEREFLLGSALLVVPQLREDVEREPALPRGSWVETGFAPLDGVIGGLGALVGEDLKLRDPDLPRLFVRGGAIIPAGPVMQHVDERLLDTLELVVCLDAVGAAEGTLYEDAGDGYGYREGQFRLTRFHAAVEGDTLIVRADHLAGDWPEPSKRRYVVTLLRGHGAPEVHAISGP